MQRLEVSGAVRLLQGSLGVKGLLLYHVLPFAVASPSLCGIHSSKLVHDMKVGCGGACGCRGRRGGGNCLQLTTKLRGGGSSSGSSSNRSRGGSCLVLLGEAADGIALAHRYELRDAGAGVEQVSRKNRVLEGWTRDTSLLTAGSTAYLTFTRNESTLVHKYYLCQTLTHTLHTHHLIDGWLHYSVCIECVFQHSLTQTRHPPPSRRA